MSWFKLTQWLTAAVLLTVILMPFGDRAFAETEDGYNYSSTDFPVPAPNAFVAVKQVYGTDLAVGEFVDPQDLFVDGSGRIYVLDMGGNRIVCLDREGKLIQEIKGFVNGEQEEAFSEPQGLFVEPNGDIYVADTGNGRIVKLAPDGKLLLTIGAPNSETLREDFEYKPVKVVVDKAKRIYALSQGAYDGILEFDSSGKFRGFIGTNRVKVDPITLFWKRISTQEQKDQMFQFVPLEFNNIDIDDKGFIYATTPEQKSTTPVLKLNPSGADVLRREGYVEPIGDLITLRDKAVSSTIIDVAADRYDMYSILDSQRGRIFTYDYDGNLLYVFGGFGSTSNKLGNPIAIDYLDDQMVVLDKALKRVSFFKPTPYAEKIREATILRYLGKSKEATAVWKDVLHGNSNFDMAYTGIGKSLFKDKQYKEAMHYFKLGNEVQLYSDAFKKYRQQLLFDHFGTICLTIAGCAVVFYVVRRKIKSAMPKTTHYEEIGLLKFPFYVILHPFKGFWELKYENKGRLKIAFAILLGVLLASILQAQLGGYIVNPMPGQFYNLLSDVQSLLAPFILWCIANWSLTTLMDGEGKFKEIVMATGYAMLPLAVVSLPLVAFSNVITVEEASFYYLLKTVAQIWFVYLLFVGIMTVHQYTPFKTVVTMLLTIVIMGVIVFLGLVFINLMNEIVYFAKLIYKEMSLR